MGDSVLDQTVSPIAIDLKGVSIAFRSARLKQEILALRDIHRIGEVDQQDGVGGGIGRTQGLGIEVGGRTSS